MAERPYVAGAVAIGIVAAALHLGTAPAPPASHGSSTVSGGSHARQLPDSKSAFDQVLWSSEMKSHPDNLGTLTAQNEFEETIRDFYTAPPKPTPGAVATPAGTLEVMIAIEPDPVHTHLALLFDRDIDALEDALQESGYQYQSNWLPWSPSSSAPTTGDRFSDQEQQRLFLKGRENYPGVILFRHDPPVQPSDSAATGTGPPCTTNCPSSAPADNSIALARQPLAVFLVGDSPTAGIDPTQFEEALSQLKTWAPNQHELRILGPTFTGSGPSLRTLLSGEAVKSLGLNKITIASGSLTDSKCSDLLPAGTIDKYCHCTNGDHPVSTFVSFGIDKDWRTDQIGAFLHKQGQFKPQDIAELSEDESSYGWKGGPETPMEKGYLHLHFPRNISHLRSAYQNSNIFGFGVSAQGSGNISLNLDLNEASGDDDSIPNFAQQQMPVSQDGVMHQITDILEQRHIKVAVLSATDVLDELFVAEIVARQAPNTLVVINQADDLFLRSSSPNDFVNMYFVSPWPLINDDQLRSRLSDIAYSPPVFPSDSAEGVYAATQYLYPPAGRAPYLPDYSSPLFPTKRPPLWISAIGHGDYWPIALLNDPDSRRRSPFHLPAVHHQAPRIESFRAEHFQTERPPLSQNLIVLLLCSLALYHTAKCFGVSALKDFSLGYTINDADARTPKLFLQLGITVLLLLALQLSISPSNHSGPALDALHAGSAALCGVAAYLICLITATAFNPPSPWPLTQKSMKSVLVISAVLIISTVAGVTYLFVARPLLWDWLSMSSGFPDFFEYRANYPLRGVSPVFPLFLTVLAFCILFYSHLDRIAFTPNRCPRLPDAVHDLPSCPSDGDLKKVTDLLYWPPNARTILSKSALLALVVVFVEISIKPLHIRPQMFDGPSLQRCLGLAMFLLVVAILWELAMAAVLWQRLKSLCLERLESSSLRRGFSSVSGLTWSSLWIFRGSISARYRAIYRLLEQASRGVLQEAACLPQASPNLEEAVQTLWAAVAASRSNPDSQSHPQLVVKAFGAVQEQIAAVAGQLLVTLKTAWQKEKGRITACDANEDEGKSTGSPTAAPDEPIEPLQQLREEWVALVYIHYIRMVLLQVRSRLVTAATLYLFLVWAATCYPYLNRHVLLIALSALLGLLSFAVILIYASINRDPILSRTTNHTPGHLDLDFYLKTASLVGVPLIGFIASQFPEVSSFLFSWIEPGMATVK
jgi:hypothetical protein